MCRSPPRADHVTQKAPPRGRKWNPPSLTRRHSAPERTTNRKTLRYVSLRCVNMLYGSVHIWFPLHIRHPLKMYWRVFHKSCIAYVLLIRKIWTIKLFMNWGGGQIRLLNSKTEIPFSRLTIHDLCEPPPRQWLILPTKHPSPTSRRRGTGPG